MAEQPMSQGASTFEAGATVDKVPCWGLDCDVMFEPWTNEWHCSDECYEKHRAVKGEGARR
jgi:hypothetical protein